MNPTEHQWRRLWRAALQAREPVPELPVGLEARVLNAWRKSRQVIEHRFAIPLLRWAVMYACLVMIASILWNFLTPASPNLEVISLANSTIQASLAP